MVSVVAQMPTSPSKAMVATPILHENVMLPLGVNW